ncbi:DHH family phosphoesterase [Natranaeroarchaeum aerophilus]|uniref:DHH family phosphoesterase n=1 Tax=Natranaeroarchaeum aerophilus TaxID=2917711 RepID=A0AAE3FV22_9EURY|nr:DHH family phosphoesterase [Natranaeroarchaeum aerophilus]MCL9815104.1 DHH family phosphoesterase [Natranaeroarchaeum aerophilus]
MVSRLLLGCGTVGQTLASRIAGKDGTLQVIADDPDRIDALRGPDRSVTEGDPTNPKLLAEVTATADVVIIADDDSKRNVQMAKTARDVYPNAFVLAYSGTGPTDSELSTLRELTDRMMEPSAELAGHVLGFATGPEAMRSRRLRSTLQSIDGRLAVIAHDNPDPDAIGSAVALTRLAEHVGVDAVPCHYGSINHQENQAMVNLLDIDLRQLDPNDPEELGEFSGVALVDHSRPGINDQLPEELAIDIVIDHHPPRGPVDGRFVDIRSDAGATCTLLVDYFSQFDLDLDETVASALLYGIRIDTDDFEREVSDLDFRAASELIKHANTSLLERVESPSVSGETLDTVARAIESRQVDGSILTTSVGEISDRDSLAQAADQLLEMDGVSATLVWGVIDDTIYVSARSRGGGLDLGETLRQAFNRIGSAGGHSDMAGAQIPIGVLGTVEDTNETRESVVEDVVRDRFFEALHERPFDLPDEYVDEVSEFEFPLLSANSSPPTEDR